MYRLKPGIESFQVVDGPMAGRKFKKGVEYRADQIPSHEMGKFEKTNVQHPTSNIQRRTKEKKKEKKS